MVFFNYALRKLNAKIVYYGPGLCGKTTNLEWIHDHFEGGKKGNMLSLATEGDRTIFFDLLPLDIGTIRGMDVTLQLYTVPGQVHYNSTRQLVLRGADGVVFVADSQRAMLGSNLDSWKNLKENLLLQGVELASFPHVLQFNKRDLSDIAPVEQLDAELNEYSAPIFEAVAIQGIGVQETLEGIVKLVMRSLRDRYEAEFAGSTTPTVSAGVASFQTSPSPAAFPAAPAPAGPSATAPQPPEAATAPPALSSPPEAGDRSDSTREPDAETHPGIAAMSLGAEMEEEKEPTLVIAPEEIGLPASPGDGVGEVELETGPLETADIGPAGGDVVLSVESEERETESLAVTPSEESWKAEQTQESGEVAEPAVEEVPEPQEAPAAPPYDVEGASSPEEEAGDEAWVDAAPAAGTVEFPEPPGEHPEWPAADDVGGEPAPADVPEVSVADGVTPSGTAGEEAVSSDASAEAPPAVPEETGESFVEDAVRESREPFGMAEPEPAGEDVAVAAGPETVEAGTPFEAQIPAAEPPAADDEASAEDVEAGPVEPEPGHQGAEPFTVWDGEPFGDLVPPPDAAVPTVLAPVEAQAVTGREGQNQLRLQLEGTGALAEYGQVRELDIVVPVPGDWIGGQKVTLQFRLTLVPKAEEEEG